MAKQYEEFRRKFDKEIKKSFLDSLPTVQDLTAKDLKHEKPFADNLRKAKDAVAQLKKSDLEHSRKLGNQIANTTSDKNLAERSKTKFDLTKPLADIKSTLVAWEQDKTRYQNLAKTCAAAVKTNLADWEIDKAGEEHFEALVGAPHRKMVADFETELAKEIASRKKQLTTKLGTGNKSVADMEKLLEESKKFKASDGYKHIAGRGAFSLAAWKTKKETEIGKDVLGWEPLDLAKWKNNNITQVKNALKLTNFDF